jgi:hypothetical protein
MQALEKGSHHVPIFACTLDFVASYPPRTWWWRWIESAVEGREVLGFVALEIGYRTWGGETVANAIAISGVKDEGVFRV